MGPVGRLCPLITMAAVLLFGACREDNKLGTARDIDADRMPRLSTRNVSTLISDSGYTRYKVVTPLWNIYQNKDNADYWDFPEGVFLRQLDHDLKVVSTVAADSACYFPDRKLWELYGDVEIDQKERAYFFTQRIFFDDKSKRIYSDTFIHVKTPTQILEGIGFESNQDMTRYRVIKPTGVFPLSEFKDGPTEGERRELTPEDRGFREYPDFENMPAPDFTSDANDEVTPPAEETEGEDINEEN